jgi:hypothetical protein
MRAIRLHERSRGRHAGYELGIRNRRLRIALRRRQCWRGNLWNRLVRQLWSARRSSVLEPRRRRSVSAVRRASPGEPYQTRQRREHALVCAFEEVPPSGIDSFGVVEVLLEELTDVA